MFHFFYDNFVNIAFAAWITHIGLALCVPSQHWRLRRSNVCVTFETFAKQTLMDETRQIHTKIDYDWNVSENKENRGKNGDHII